jgi:hypothetical protein
MNSMSFFHMNMERVKTAFVLILIQLGLCCLFALSVTYHAEADASNVRNSIDPVYGGSLPNRNPLKNYYSSNLSIARHQLGASVSCFVF